MGYVSEKRGVDLGTETVIKGMILFKVAVQLSHPAAAYGKYLPLCGIKSCHIKGGIFYVKE